MKKKASGFITTSVGTEPGDWQESIKNEYRTKSVPKRSVTATEGSLRVAYVLRYKTK